MRRFATVCTVLLVVGSPFAQVGLADGPAAGDALTHGGFSALLLTAVQAEPGAVRTAGDALLEVKKAGLAPQSWSVDATLTHGELASIVKTIGGTYKPVDPEAPASRAFTEALLQRQAEVLKQHAGELGTKAGAGSYAMDFTTDPQVSPSNF